MGYIVGFKSGADKGKTLAMIASVMYLVDDIGFPGESVHGNLTVRIPGYNKYDNAGLRQVLRNMCREHWTKQIILIDEADGVFPARFYSDKKQTEDLLGLWQVTKLGNWVMYTQHLGRACDKILMDCTQFSIVPEYIEERDSVHVTIINGIDLNIIEREIYPISKAFGKYFREEPVF